MTTEGFSVLSIIFECGTRTRSKLVDGASVPRYINNDQYCTVIGTERCTRTRTEPFARHMHRLFI